MRALVLTAVVLICACASSTGGTPSARTATNPVPSTITGPCPVTPPTAVTGPNPNLVFTAGPNEFLYGNDALIVSLPNDGTLHPADPLRGLPGGVKFAWGRITAGALVIGTRRLDAVTVPRAADLPSGMNFASPGCWEVTGTVGGKTLTFVVNVAAQ